MLLTRRTLHWIVPFLVTALLVARMGGAHLHLCFDGKEPPAHAHFGDSTVWHHDSAGETPEHRDLDISLVQESLSKPKLSATDLPLLLFAVVLLWSLTLGSLARVALPRAEPGKRNTHALRPPQRGPPPSFSR